MNDERLICSVTVVHLYHLMANDTLPFLSCLSSSSSSCSQTLSLKGSLQGFSSFYLQHQNRIEGKENAEEEGRSTLLNSNKDESSFVCQRCCGVVVG